LSAPRPPADVRSLSVVVPVRDEVDSIEPLLLELDAALGHLALALEWIFVDDGSVDGSLARLRGLMGKDGRLRVLRLDGAHGQSAALDAGFRAACGDAVAVLDADGQSDPADLPRMLAALSGADVVNGVRVQREDEPLRVLASQVARVVRQAVLGDRVRDIGCATRVMRRDWLRRIRLYRGLHRFLPVLLEIEGARLAELPVSHRPRRHGRSKYGIWSRLPEAAVDLCVVAWMRRRALHARVEEESPPR